MMRASVASLLSAGAARTGLPLCEAAFPSDGETDEEKSEDGFESADARPAERKRRRGKAGGEAGAARPGEDTAAATTTASAAEVSALRALPHGVLENVVGWLTVRDMMRVCSTESGYQREGDGAVQLMNAAARAQLLREVDDATFAELAHKAADVERGSPESRGFAAVGTVMAYESRIPRVVRLLEQAQAELETPRNMWCKLQHSMALAGFVQRFTDDEMVSLSEADKDQLLRAAQLGNPIAQREFGLVASATSSFALAVHWLRRAAPFDALGKSFLATTLSFPTSHGEHDVIPVDPAFILDMYRAAATKGVLEAQVNLGMIYHGTFEPFSGRALRQYRDPPRAFAWWSSAAKGGQVEALINLGHLYSTGMGVAQDTVKAFQLWKRLAGLSDVRGIFLTALCFATGHGVAQNNTKAVLLFTNVVRCNPGSALSTDALRFIHQLTPELQ